MIKPRIEDGNATHWWAAVVAPLVGIPILVALLALASPRSELSVLDGDEPTTGQIEARLSGGL